MFCEKSENRVMKKVRFVMIVLLLVGALVGCNTDKTKGNTDIKSDIQNFEEFSEYDISITNMEIIKRQTNEEDKEDIVFVHVEGKNEDFSIIRNYKLLYVLYNDGWMLEKTESYTDENYYDTTTPLHGVSSEKVELEFEELLEGASNTYFTTQLENVSIGEVEKIIEETEYEVYQQVSVYEYALFKEVVTSTVYFETYNLMWCAEREQTSALYLKEEALGRWKADVEVGWDFLNGIYQGGNDAEGQIVVLLSKSEGTEVTCNINSEIRTKRYGTDVGCHKREGIAELKYMYDDDGYISGVVVYDHNSAKYYDYKNLYITLDGMYYGNKDLNWKLTKQ